MDISDRIEKIWDELDDGDREIAFSYARALAGECPDDPEALLVYAEVSFENDAIEQCRVAAENTLSLLEPSANSEAPRQIARALGWLARVEWRQWRFSAAEKKLRNALDLASNDPVLWRLLAEVLERTNRSEEAIDADRRAQRLDPGHFFVPVRFSREEAEEALREAIDALPDEFQRAAATVPIVLEDFPSRDMARAESPDELPLPPDILGLYSGVSLADRSFFHAFEPPGTILLFQRNLERICVDRDTLVEEIAMTLEHELAHHLGFDESAMPDLGLE